MLRTLVKDTLWYGLGTVLTRSLSVLLLPLYARALGPSGVGVLDYALAVGAFLTVVIGLEIYQGLGRYYPELVDRTEQRRYASTSLWLTVVAYTLGLAVLAAVLPLVQDVFPDTLTSRVLVALAGYLWVTGVSQALHSQLRWAAKAREAVIAAVVGSLATILAIFVTVVIYDGGVPGVLFATTLGAVITGAVAYLFEPQAFAFVFDRRVAGELLRFSLPLVPSSLGVVITLYVDRVVVERLLGVDDLGVYGVGLRLASLAAVLLGPIQLAVSPLVYRHYREPNTATEITRFARLVFTFGSALAVLFVFWGGRVFTVVAGAGFGTPPVEFVGVLLAAVLLSRMYVFAPGLALAKRTGVITAINLTAATASLLLSIPLTQRFGLPGTAVASLAVALGSYLAYELLGRRTYACGLGWPWATAGAGGVLVAFRVATGLESGSGIGEVARWLLSAFVAVMAGAVAWGVVRPSRSQRRAPGSSQISGRA